MAQPRSSLEGRRCDSADVISPRVTQLVEELLAQYRAEVNRAITVGDSWELRVAHRKATNGTATEMVPARHHPYRRSPMVAGPSDLRALPAAPIPEKKEASTQTNGPMLQNSTEGAIITSIGVQTEDVIVLGSEDGEIDFDDDFDLLQL